MTDENTARVEEDVLRTDPFPENIDVALATQDHPSYMTDDEVERAAEKVFRLHARLFEELAK